MKSEKTITTFVCDQCETKYTKEIGEKYPYDKGWIYLYKLNFQLIRAGTDIIRIELKDLHFCKAKCYQDHIGNWMIGKEKKERKKKIER